MRFKFCGDLDISVMADWVLSKILLISKLSTNDLNMISNEVLNDILEGQLDFDKISKQLDEYKFKEVDCKGIIAALAFIFKNSSKHSCDHEILCRELQQLGLHRDGANLLSRVYQLKFKELRKVLEQKSFRINRLSHIDWNIKRELDTNMLQCNIPLVEMNIKFEQNDKPETRSLLLTVDKLLVLSEELKNIKKTMARINSEL